MLNQNIKRITAIVGLRSEQVKRMRGKEQKESVLISPTNTPSLANLFGNYHGPIMADFKEALGSSTKSYFI